MRNDHHRTRIVTPPTSIQPRMNPVTHIRALPLIGCRRARSLLSGHIDGDLDDTNRHFLSTHLAHCGRCRRILATLTAMIDSLRTLPADQAPPSGTLAHAVAQRLADDSHSP
jgi:anti-sigma factor RsiW